MYNFASIEDLDLDSIEVFPQNPNTSYKTHVFSIKYKGQSKFNFYFDFGSNGRKGNITPSDYYDLDNSEAKFTVKLSKDDYFYNSIKKLENLKKEIAKKILHYYMSFDEKFFKKHTDYMPLNGDKHLKLKFYKEFKNGNKDLNTFLTEKFQDEVWTSSIIRGNFKNFSTEGSFENKNDELIEYDPYIKFRLCTNPLQDGNIVIGKSVANTQLLKEEYGQKIKTTLPNKNSKFNYNDACQYFDGNNFRIKRILLQLGYASSSPSGVSHTFNLSSIKYSIEQAEASPDEIDDLIDEMQQNETIDQ